ncbi:hypothetical protein CKO23_14560 [Thiocystis violacea]|nr:hypothetical protein [Thiocystis violacea]
MCRVSIALCAWALSGPALAHKLKVFASAVGDRIEGTAYFAGGNKASGAIVVILDADGHDLAHLRPATDGSFSYQALAPVEHRVIARTDDGHQAEWRITAAELRPAFGGTLAPNPSPSMSAAAPAITAGSPPEVASPPSPEPVGPETLSAIELAVAHQIRPLREQLAAAEDRARLHDILGGIGYILGLAGLTLWWRCRKTDARA